MRNPARTRTVLSMLAALGAVGGSLAPAHAQPAPQIGYADQKPAVESIVGRLPDISARLAGLVPSDPEAYYLLGEEVASESTTDNEYALARELYVRAFVYGREQNLPSSYLASVSIALADLSVSNADRRWLVAVARTLDVSQGLPDWSRAVERPVSVDAGYEASTALGLVRSGDGGRARKQLQEPESRELFEAYGGLITGTPGEDAFPLVESAAERWPCPECRNKRISSSRGENPTQRLCLTCLGNPGWKLTNDQLIGTLRFESFLLKGVQRSWAAQYASDEGDPLQDPDAGQLASAFKVRTERPYWRNGSWVATPDRGGDTVPPDPETARNSTEQAP